MPIITLTTDFGLYDPYVAAMKGVILEIAPESTIVDISHEVPRQQIREAAYILRYAAPYFPRGTIHVVVVDPGVGSSRRPIGVRTEKMYFVAPDNGVLGYVLEQEKSFEAIHLNVPEYWHQPISKTFHGRDIFAPVAAHLAAGVPFESLGTPVEDLVRISWPLPKHKPDGCIEGEIIHVDRFGNLVSNIPGEEVEGREYTVVVNGATISEMRATYADVYPGALLALVGSHGYVEIAVREGNAAHLLGVTTGEKITICPAP
jgi:S-adenosylmethionine hydrolase